MQTGTRHTAIHSGKRRKRQAHGQTAESTRSPTTGRDTSHPRVLTTLDAKQLYTGTREREKIYLDSDAS